MQEDSISRKETHNPKMYLEWTTEMKVILVQINNEKRKRGRGLLMKRVKERLVSEHPEHVTGSI